MLRAASVLARGARAGVTARLPVAPAAAARGARSLLAARPFSNDSNEDFRKTLNNVKEKYKHTPAGEEGTEASASEGANAEGATATEGHAPSGPSVFGNILSMGKSGLNAFVDNVKLAYKEMTGADKESLLSRDLSTAEEYSQNKKTGAEGEEEEAVDAGPSAIVVVKEGQNVWDQMKERLQDAPFIKEVLKRSRIASKAAASTDIGQTVTNVGKNVHDKISDMREFWETSQNPLVYTLSGVVDTITSQTEEAMALTAIKKLDPNFLKEDWAEEVRKELVPKIIKAHLVGDIKVLKQWLGEAVYNKLAADISTRKHDGYVFNSNLLEVDEAAMMVNYLEDQGPIIVGVYAVQQINCIKNRKGEIMEGGETDIVVKTYSLAFQLKYEEEANRLSWKIVDYQFGGDTPYI